jgi:hypothetical protein
LAVEVSMLCCVVAARGTPCWRVNSACALTWLARALSSWARAEASRAG